MFDVNKEFEYKFELQCKFVRFNKSKKLISVSMGRNSRRLNIKVISNRFKSIYRIFTFSTADKCFGLLVLTSTAR